MAFSKFFTSDLTQSDQNPIIGHKEIQTNPTVETKILWILSLLLGFAGIFIRIERALLGRSFDGDEAANAITIISHSMVDLITKPVAANITAPIGFLVIEKFVTQLFGYQDFYLRLIPLIAGCASVILIYFLAREILDGFGQVFAVGAFSLNWWLSFYSSELKQYSTDVAIALLIYLLAARYFKKSSIANLSWLTGIGVIGVFCSHSSIFILSSLGLVLMYKTWEEKGKFKRIIIAGSLWVFAFLILYIVSYRFVGQNPYTLKYWNDIGALMPIPPWKNPGWFVQRFNAFFVVDLNLTQLTWIEAVLYLIGITFFYLKKKKEWALILLGSLLFTLLASAAVNYPFKDRLILFLAPSVLLVIGSGIDGLAAILRSSSFLSHSLRWVLTAYMLISPVISTYSYVLQPRAFPYKDDIKPVMLYIERHKQTNDHFVVYDQAAVTYAYYAPLYKLNNLPTIYLGDYRKKPRKYEQVIDMLPKNQRVWFVFSNVLYTLNDESDRTYMFDYLSTIGGRIIDQVGGEDTYSSAYLVIIK